MNRESPTTYYQTLRTQADADLATIKSAYRKRAMECHPDRGGSHEQMLLINEAFEILSNPETRSRYDAALSGQASRQAETDRERAREKSENYPRDWTAFQTWLDAIYNDFARANYNPHEPVGKSVSGQAFKFTGGVVGLIVAAGMIWIIFGALNWDNLDALPSWLPGRVVGLIGIKFIGKVIIVGICVALALHKNIRDTLRPTDSARQQQPSNDQNNSADSPNSLVISCPQCAQKLRISRWCDEARLRCASCGHTFMHRAGIGANPQDTLVGTYAGKCLNNSLDPPVEAEIVLGLKRIQGKQVTGNLSIFGQLAGGSEFSGVLNGESLCFVTRGPDPDLTITWTGIISGGSIQGNYTASCERMLDQHGFWHCKKSG